MRSPVLIRSLVVLSALCVASQVSAQAKPKSSGGALHVVRTAPSADAVNKKLHQAIELLRSQEEKSGEQMLVLRTLEEALAQNKKHPGLGVSGEYVKATPTDVPGAKAWIDVLAQDPAKSSKKDRAKKTENPIRATLRMGIPGEKARDAKKAAEKAYRAAKMQYERAIERAENSRRLDLLLLQESQNQEQLKRAYDRAKAVRVDAKKARQKAAQFITVIETEDGGAYATLKETSERPVVTYLLQDGDHEVIKELNRSLARAKAEDDQGALVVTGEPDAEYRVLRTKQAGGGTGTTRARSGGQSAAPSVGGIIRYTKARNDEGNDNDDIVEAIEDVAAELRAIRKLMERVHGQVQEHHGHGHDDDAKGADELPVFWGRYETVEEATDKEGRPGAVLKWVKEAPAAEDFFLAPKKSKTGMWSISAPKNSTKGEPQRIDALLPPAKAKAKAKATWRYYDVKAKAPQDSKPSRRYRAIIRDDDDEASLPSPAPRLIGSLGVVAVPPTPAAPAPVVDLALPPGPVGSPAPARVRRSVIR